jgi:hypothetical protein
MEIIIIISIFILQTLFIWLNKYFGKDKEAYTNEKGEYINGKYLSYQFYMITLISKIDKKSKFKRKDALVSIIFHSLPQICLFNFNSSYDEGDTSICICNITIVFWKWNIYDLLNIK